MRGKISYENTYRNTAWKIKNHMLLDFRLQSTVSLSTVLYCNCTSSNSSTLYSTCTYSKYVLYSYIHLQPARHVYFVKANIKLNGTWALLFVGVGILNWTQGQPSAVFQLSYQSLPYDSMYVLTGSSPWYLVLSTNQMLRWLYHCQSVHHFFLTSCKTLHHSLQHGVTTFI